MVNLFWLCRDLSWTLAGTVCVWLSCKRMRTRNHRNYNDWLIPYFIVSSVPHLMILVPCWPTKQKFMMNYPRHWFDTFLRLCAVCTLTSLLRYSLSWVWWVQGWAKKMVPGCEKSASIAHARPDTATTRDLRSPRRTIVTLLRPTPDITLLASQRNEDFNKNAAQEG